MDDRQELKSLNFSAARKSFSIPHVGVLTGFLGGFIFALSAIFAKLITVSPILVAAFQSYMRYFLLLPVIFYALDNKVILGPQKNKVYLWLQGLFLALAGLFFFLTLGELSPGTTVTLTYLEAVISPVLARIFFKESLTILDSFFALLCVCGVVLIAKPPFIFRYLSDGKTESAIGIVYGLTSAFLAAIGHVLIRKIGHCVNFLNTVFTNLVSGCVLGTFLIYFTGVFEFPCTKDLLFIALVGVTVLLAQIAIIFALKHERPGTVAILQTPKVIIVYIFQVIILHDVSSMLSWIGSGLIFIASVCVGIRKIVNERKADGHGVAEE